MQHTVERTAAPTQQAAQRHFDRWAWIYSRSRLLASLQRMQIAELGPKSDDRVLDVACGAGKLVRAVAPDVSRAVGVDLSPAMIDEAHERTAREAPASAGRLEFVVGPSDNLPFGDGEFTAVVTTTAFHHFPDPEGSIREMARVLAPGGRIVIGDMVRDRAVSKIGDRLLKRFERGHVGLQPTRGFERLLEDAGLRVTRSRPVWLNLYTLVNGTKPAA